MTRSYPPQRFCDKCGEPDLEFPYTSYTGQIPQITRVILGAEYHHSSGIGSIPPPDKVGIDLGDLCQKCRYDIYIWFLKVWDREMQDYKTFPKKMDEYSPHFTEANSNNKVKPYWEKDIIIKDMGSSNIIKRIKI